MTPETWSGIAELIDRYGLPLAMLGGFLYLVLRRKFVTGAELTAMTALFERERADRIAAEANLAKFAGANAEVAEAVRDVLSEVVKTPHDERLAGRRGR